MKAVVFHGVGDIRLDEVPEPVLQQPTDALVRLTASAMCGTDLHLVRGTVGPMRPGTILGHEGVGVVEALGSNVRNLKVGDRVVICPTIACGKCVYCRAGYYSQCDDANPNGKLAGTAYFGSPEAGGSFHGMQAERVRVPFAHVGLVKVPEVVSDDQAILISDVFPTGYFGAKLAEVQPGDTVVVYGCGPVGQFSIVSAKLLGAGRVFAVDTVASRLETARAQGAEVIDFNREDPVEVIRELTGGIGVDRAIDAVGVDAMAPSRGPAAKKVDRGEMARELEEIAPGARKKGDWQAGDAPSQTLTWAVESLDKAGTLAIVGVYPTSARTFPIGLAMNKNLTMKMGNCNHRKYVPRLLELVRSGAVDPAEVLAQHQPVTSALEAYLAFDHREPGWMKVELQPLHS